MDSIASWQDGSQLLEFLADQLRKRRLAIVLGAGVSKGLGLADWPDLVKQLYGAKKEVLDPTLRPEDASEWLYNRHYEGRDAEFVQDVRQALYMTSSATSDSLATNRLLNALGAIMTQSSRGSVAAAVTFNFDDLLEVHLKDRGFRVNSIHSLPSWNIQADMELLHIHGLLPRDVAEPCSEAIVFTQADFDRVVGNANVWNERVLSIFRSHTCLFMGLSGNDNRLSSMLMETSDKHVGMEEGHAYWGVRFFADSKDPLIDKWQKRGVYCHKLDSHDALPGWLMAICKRAAAM